MSATKNDGIEAVRRELDRIARDAESLGDYETADSIMRSVNIALASLTALEQRLAPELKAIALVAA